MRPNIFAGPLALAVCAAFVSVGAAHAGDAGSNVSRNVNADGSSAVSVSNSPTWLDGVSYGLDLSLAANVVTTVQPTRALPWEVTDNSGAAAWAKMALPTDSIWLPWQKTTLEMRVDPSQNEGRFGTVFSREVKLSDHMAASVNDSYALTHKASEASGWEVGKSVSLKLLDTGTTFSVGATNSNLGQAWLPTASAEQKLFGPLNVTTTVQNTGTEINKSISAGFKHSW
ncbi:hypothetical protein ACLBXM_07150 [Xanthobacteraceae bacterium A53D]